MRIEQLETPALILDLDILERNLERMQSFCNEIGIAMRPHYKSHKCTAIAHLQIKGGAKGLCCAKLSEAEDLIQAGIEDVLIANQVTDRAKISRLAYLASCCHLTVCVDQSGNIADLEAAAGIQGSAIHCFVEYDIGMHRCGVYTKEEVLSLARQIEASPHLVFEGIQAYGGHMAHHLNDEERKAYVASVQNDLKQLREYLHDNRVIVKEISGISTGTILLQPQDTVYTEMQAGSYIFMDSAYRALNLDFENSLFVLTSVVRVSNGYCVFDAGLKSVSVDQKPPYLAGFPKEAVNFSEEHCTVPIEGPAVNDKLFLVPSHCCTAMNLHDFLYFTRGGKVVDRVPINSRGKSR